MVQLSEAFYGEGVAESRTVVIGQGEAQCSGERYGDGVVQCDTVL